jgi:hypothetical protein
MIFEVIRTSDLQVTDFMSMGSNRPRKENKRLGALYIPYVEGISKKFKCKWNSHKAKLHGPSPRANYTDRVTAACRRSDCQLLRIEGATWSA